MRFDMNLMSRWSAVTAAILLTQSCGKAVSNENIPKAADELTTDDIDDAGVLARQAKWNEMATALGIGNNQAETSAALLTQLGTPSTYLTTNTAGLPGLMTTLVTQYAAKANLARCAAIDSVTEWKAASDATGAAVAAKVYLMKYKLQTNSAGTAEDIVRSGLLVVPDAGSANARLVAYGHGGDSGLAYPDVAANWGALQASNVIVAPAFPGEAVCNASTGSNKACDDSGNYAEAAGAAVPYDNDADDLLGMYDCVVRAYNGNVSSNAAPFDLSAATGYADRLKPNGGGAHSALPQSVLAGAARGRGGRHCRAASGQPEGRRGTGGIRRAQRRCRRGGGLWPVAAPGGAGRAAPWLFQPACLAAAALARCGADSPRDHGRRRRNRHCRDGHGGRARHRPGFP